MELIQSTAREAHYNRCRSAWNAVGALIRGPITDALKNTKGPFAAGEHPGEADCKWTAVDYAWLNFVRCSPRRHVVSPNHF